jgi:OFA family oxalate/formate antiporter-like MFS transporter
VARTERADGGRLPFSRWWLVVFAALAFGAAGTYQFVWSSVRTAVGARLAIPEPALGAAFTVFIVAQALAQLPAGRVRDRRGPRLLLIAGGVLLGAGYAGVALAGGALAVAAAYGLGGVGSGLIYTVAINTPVKWFDERRGLATGLVTMAYGGISGLLIPAIRGGLDAAFRPTLFLLGAGAGIACLLAVPVLRDPGEADDGPSPDSRGAYDWRATVRTWQFWLLYAVFVVVNGVGLMFIGKAVELAASLGLSPATGTGAAAAVALADSAGIVVGGAASDRFGGERTVAVALVICGGVLAGGVLAGGAGLGLAYVALLAAAAFFRAPVFSIFPGLVGEYYGTARSSENYAALYTAKIWGGVGGGAAASLTVAALGWTPAFLLGAALLVAAGAGTAFLRPVERSRRREREPAEAETDVERGGDQSTR